MRRALLACLLSLAVVPSTAAALDTGVVVGINNNVDTAAETTAAGGKWVRLFFDWNVPDTAGLERTARALHDKGVKVLVVVTNTHAEHRPAGSSPTTPPTDPNAYGAFMGELAKSYGEFIDAYEVWNEPNDKIFWLNGPKPEQYVPLLKSAYANVKQNDPTAFVVTGGMVGNDFNFLDAIYKLGGKGSFDAVGVHTDTACTFAPPEQQYRDEQGRIGQYTFTGYREVRQTMLDHGESKPIWMTEMGWPTPGDGVKCMMGGKPFPGKEDDPGGVDYATQADYLRRGLSCMHAEDIVTHAFWFSLQDINTASPSHEERYGLIEGDGDKKPSYNALKDWNANPQKSAACGEPVDRVAPAVSLSYPADGHLFAGPLTVKGVASDNVRVNKMELWVDGERIGGPQSGASFSLDPWSRARDLPRGDHKLVLKAFDGALNVGQQVITIKKVAEDQVPTTEQVRLKFRAKKKGKRKVRVLAKVIAPEGATVTPTGKVTVFMDIKRGKKYKRFTRLTSTAEKGIKRTYPLKARGKWRVWAFYYADAPYKNARSKYKKMRAR